MTLFVGVDWSNSKHDVCAVNADGVVLGERTFAHTAEGLNALCDWILAFGTPQAVAIETPRGLVVDALLERAMAVYSLNPKQVDRFRDRFSVAGSKDDRLDARVLASAVRTDGHLFRVIEADDPLIVELRSWMRMREELVISTGSLVNKLAEQVGRFRPEVRRLLKDAPEWTLEALERYPTAERAKSRGCKQAIARLLKKHRIRRVEAHEVVAALRAEHRVAAGVIEGACAHISMLIERLRFDRRQLRKADKRVDELLEELDAAANEGPADQQSDVAILLSFPGLGRITAATLLVEGARHLKARDYRGLRALAGVAPVSRASGKSSMTVMRRARNVRLANSMHTWAGTAAQRDSYWKERYAGLTEKHSKPRARRGLADAMLRVVIGMLKSGSLYESGRLQARNLQRVA